MAVHPLVRTVAEAFLRAVDDELPGLVEGLYLTGS
ncbi:MAG TPA: DNA polymerase subunit beta, partial [Thermobifida alba]|nr:DNA polymerase subunit beta [Thermobifida alba]